MRRSCSSSLFRCFIFLSSVTVSAALAKADPIVYGDYAGMTVDYLGNQEESISDSGPPSIKLRPLRAMS